METDTATTTATALHCATDPCDGPVTMVRTGPNGNILAAYCDSCARWQEYMGIARVSGERWEGLTSYQVRMRLHPPLPVHETHAVPPGVYRHFKGGLYQVDGLAQHTETGEILVLYRAIDALPGQIAWVRPMAMFIDMVVLDGQPVPRFTWVRPLDNHIP